MTENPVEIKNGLLLKLSSKQITQEEFDRECAYWFLDCFSDLRALSLPTPPPRYAEYERGTFAEKRDTPNEFWKKPDIYEYMNSKDRVKNENASNLHWLKFWKECLPEQDQENRKKFDSKIQEFEYKIGYSGYDQSPSWYDKEKA